MGWRRVLVVAVLSSACNYREAFEDYCADTGYCQCTDGACCVVEQFRCDQFACCEGLACVDGRCVVPAELTASPNFVNFGRITPATNATARITLANVGTAATPSPLEVTVSAGFTIDANGCNRVLAPQERCEVIVACRASGLSAELTGALTAQSGRQILNIGLTAQTGARITLFVSGAARITEVHSGQSCPVATIPPTSYSTCGWTFPFDTVLELRHGPVAEGYTMVSSQTCRWVDGACTVVADVSKIVYAYPQANLQVLVDGTGRVEGVAPVCQRVSGDPGTISFCQYPVTGPVTLTAVPTAPATRFEWSGACSGTGACQVDVQGPITIWANFR